MKFINEIFGIDGVIELGRYKNQWEPRKNDLGDWLVENKQTLEFFAVIGEETARALSEKLNDKTYS